jgi:DNA-binding NarL/FixJ family response regulator
MGNRVQILLAEDQDVFARALETMLESEPGLEVVGRAADGDEAIEMAARLKPDVLVIDQCMPGRNGLDSVRAMRARHVEVPRVILLSAYTDIPLAEACEVGVALCLRKNRSFQELARAIRALTTGAVSAGRAVEARAYRFAH